MRKYWDMFVRWIEAIPYDKMLHLFGGVLAAAFVAIVFGFPLPILAAALAGLMKEAFDKYTTGVVEWWDFAYTCAGGAVIQIFSTIALLV